MPIVAAKEIHAGRDFDEDAQVKRYTRVFMVRALNRLDEGTVIQEASEVMGLPVIGAQHPKDPEARCISARGANSSGPFLWTCTYGYSTDFDFDEDPRNDPVEITWDDGFKSELTDIDRDGNVMANSAGDPFDKPINVDVGIKTATLKFNIDGEQPPPDWVFDLPSDPELGRYTVNDQDVLVDGRFFYANSIRFERAAVGVVKTRNKIKYRPVTCKISTDPNEFKIERLDEGFRERTEFLTSYEMTPIREKDGTKAQKPHPLDGAGNKLINPTTETLVTVPFRLYREADLTVVKGIEALEEVE